VVAFIGKVLAGIAAGPVNKWLVGWGMAPRGEVGLIFAAVGQKLGVVTAEMYSIIIIVVILTTLFTPPILSSLLKRT
jgi:Kef-type K+ transport system membrane component KefB